MDGLVVFPKLSAHGAAGYDQIQGLATQGFPAEQGVLSCVHPQKQVQSAAQQQFLQISGVAQADLHLHIGKMFPEFRYRLRNQDTAPGHGQAQAQRASGTAADVGQFVFHAVLQGADPGQIAHHGPALLRQTEMGLADKEGDAVSFFDALDVVAEALRCHIGDLRRPGKVQLPGSQQKHLKAGRHISFLPELVVRTAGGAPDRVVEKQKSSDWQYTEKRPVLQVFS